MNTKTKKVKTPKATKPGKTFTLDQFRAWLSGVEEMQSEGWSPDQTQWKRIREKIDEIVDNPRSFNSGAAGAPSRTEEPAHAIRPSGPSLLTPAMMAPTQTPPPTFIATSDMPVKGQGGVNGPRIKTPNVDTSAQPYSSSLE